MNIIPLRVLLLVNNKILYPLWYNFLIIYYICTLKGININCMSISEHIKTRRKQYGLTQVELAERAGVGLRFVRELERGKSTVQLDKVNMVLKLFGEELRPAKIEQIV